METLEIDFNRFRTRNVFKMTYILEILYVQSCSYLEGHYRGISQNVHNCWIYVTFYAEKYQKVLIIFYSFSWTCLTSIKD